MLGLYQNSHNPQRKHKLLKQFGCENALKASRLRRRRQNEMGSQNAGIVELLISLAPIQCLLTISDSERRRLGNAQ